MTPLLTVTIPGDPVPQGRARVGLGHHTMDKKSREWRKLAVAAISWAWIHNRRPPVDALVAIEVDVHTSRPGSRPRLVTPAAWASGERCLSGGRGDPDNYGKAALDALVDAKVLLDDHTVCDLRVRKWYAAKGAKPGVDLRIALADEALTLTRSLETT